MAYIFKSCIDESSIYIVDLTGEYAVDDVFSFTGETEEIICGKLVKFTDDLPNYTPISDYNDCCECYSASSYQSLQFEGCDGRRVIVDLTGFCENYGSVPQLGDVFSFSENNEYVICARYLGISTSSSTETFFVEQKYDDCLSCVSELPSLTAGTPYEVCLVCCPCESGGTITSIDVPHPTFTNLFGRGVVQASAVLLGGNGLNS